MDKMKQNARPAVAASSVIGWSSTPLEHFNVQTSIHRKYGKGTKGNLRVERRQRFLTRISVSINNKVSLRLSTKGD